MEDEKEKNISQNSNNNKEKEEDIDSSLEIDNLNINQEVDIKENPKKHIVNSKKKQILKNSIDSNHSEDLNISNDNKIMNSSKRIHITYDDIYLGNEMFFSAPKSYPRDNEKNNKYLFDFSKLYTKKYSEKRNNSNFSINSGSFSNISYRDSLNNISTNNGSSISLGEEEEDDDDDVGILRNNSLNNLDNKKESTHLNDFLISLNNYRTTSNIFSEEKSTFLDEDEKKNMNLFFIENETELNNLNYYTKKNKCNISFISLNLFIKKICTENLKAKFPLLYKSFMSQYQEFLPIEPFIEKIMNALEFYIIKMGIEVPDLVSLLNKVISTQYKSIENNQDLIDKLIELYKNLKKLDWVTESLEKEIDNVTFILSSSEGDDFDVAYTKYLISDRKKTKAIAIRPRVRGKIVNNKPIYKNPYFYIFDFSDEEIARNLTLISYKMISCIDINELWSNNFIKEDKYTKAPNVMKVLDRFDKLMLFIIEDICSYETNKARARLITKWANIAQKCRDLHNYNDLLIINQCFNNILIKKMISTWKKIPKSTLELIADLNKFCSNQQCYINIRREIVGCKHMAYIPYLGILLKEILDIENNYKYAENFGDYNCINCVKLQKIYWIVNKFFQFKNYSFTFTQINELNILNQINPKSVEEIEEIINDNEKNKSTIKEFIQTGNKKKRTKTDEMFYC